MRRVDRLSQHQLMGRIIHAELNLGKADCQRTCIPHNHVKVQELIAFPQLDDGLLRSGSNCRDGRCRRLAERRVLALHLPASPIASSKSSPKHANSPQPKIGQRLAGYVGDSEPTVTGSSFVSSQQPPWDGPIYDAGTYHATAADASLVS